MSTISVEKSDSYVNFVLFCFHKNGCNDLYFPIWAPINNHDFGLFTDYNSDFGVLLWLEGDRPQKFRLDNCVQTSDRDSMYVYSLQTLAYHACTKSARDRFDSNQPLHMRKKLLLKCCERNIKTGWLSPDQRPVDRDTCEIAAENEHLECLKLAHDLGAKWTFQTMYNAIASENLDILDYAYSNGCPINDYMVLRAFQEQKMYSLRFLLHSNWVPTIDFMRTMERSGPRRMVYLFYALLPIDWEKNIRKSHIDIVDWPSKFNISYLITFFPVFVLLKTDPIIILF